MSYILDALRKSDQLRRRGAAPTLLLGEAAAAAPKQQSPLVYSLIALVLLVAGIAIGWLRPWQPEPAAPAVVAATPPAPRPRQSPTLRPEIAPKLEPQPHAQKSAAAAQAVAAPLPAPTPANSGAMIERRNAAPKAMVRASRPAAAPERAADIDSGAATPPPVIAMGELPVAIQQELPPMSISVHAYSDKAGERLVDINNRLLHEGEYVAPGLKLESITPDGMILSYRGYRFRRGVH